MKWLGAFWLTLAVAAAAEYFPAPDDAGGWRRLSDPAEIRRVTDLDVAQLDEVFEFIQGSTKNGGLLVVRHGWLVYERYFGLGHHEAAPNLASCGKSITSIAVGMLMTERPELFPDGLDQKVFTPTYFPPEAFPLTDPRQADIKLGQLLAFSAGIRGNNPARIHGEPVTLDPIGPDGWQAAVDSNALGRTNGVDPKRKHFDAATLWCEPGGGYSYASASIHLASVMLRHVTGMEMQDYIVPRLAEPLGWGRWGWGYKHHPGVDHTPGVGGIALRPTDMLRFGYLLLHDGRWRDRQLVPAEYVQHCRNASPYNPHWPYSLQFDVNTTGQYDHVPRDAFWKSGSGGHVLYIVPSLDLVVWKLGGRDAQYSPRETGLPTHPDAAREAKPRGAWKETVDVETAQRRTLQRIVAAIRPEAKSAAIDPSSETRPANLATVPLRAPADRLLVNLMVEGRLAWFSWMNRPELKPKLVVSWTTGGRTHIKTWQHGVRGSEWPQAFFLQRGDEPGHVRWAGHPDLGPGRDGHKHHFFSKDRPSRVGFLKADLSEIPPDAVITRAELVLHIHDKEGLKKGDSPAAAGVARFRHVHHDWDWDHVTFTHFAAGRPWTAPLAAYPYFGDGDVSPVLWSLDRQKDLADRGYHKRGTLDYPLDLTAYVARLQQLRATPTSR